MTIKNLIKISLTLICAATLTAATIYYAFQNSVHTVISNKVYRSAQLSPQALQHVIKAQNIQSVINLRGSNPQTTWYQQELKTTQALGIHHYDVRLSSNQLPPLEQLQRLVHLLETAPQPILLHCQSGIDRTGLASAFALILNKNATLKTAKHQFSLFYMDTDHNSVGKRVFPYYAAWLHHNKLQSNDRNLHRWAYSTNPFQRENTIKLAQSNY